MRIRFFSVAGPGRKQPERKEFNLAYSSRGTENIMLGPLGLRGGSSMAADRSQEQEAG